MKYRMEVGRGFSLLELMLVLAIIGMMTAAAAWALSGRSTQAKIRVTWTSMNTIKSAIDAYNLNASVNPPSLAALQSGNMPYLEPSKPLKDGWKNDFFYSPTGTGGRPYDLMSRGPDGKLSTPDDISIWTPPQE
jgi:type II secretion system protein G